MYKRKRYKVIGVFFACVSIYCIVYIFQLGVTLPRISGAILFALLSIGSFRQ